MAVKRIDPKATFRVIAESDDALESEGPLEQVQLLKEGKTSRYQQYLENLDESKLIFKEGAKPSYFQIRCLLPTEKAQMELKYTRPNLATGKVEVKDPILMMHEYFDSACDGIIGDDGKVEKVKADDLAPGVALQIGTVISIYTSVGKNLKK